MSLVLSGTQGISTNGLNYIKVDETGTPISSNRPCFHAANSTNPASSTLSNENLVMKFDVIVINVGGGYSNSTYRFTAPVAGKYFCYAQCRFDGLTGYSRLYITKNGASSGWWAPSGIHNISPNASFAYWSHSCSGIIDLAVGDFITAQGGANNGVGTNQGEGSFGAFLIG